MDWAEITKHLTAPLNPDVIQQPPRGKYGEYVTGLHVIREANRIFGHGGWSYQVTRLEQTHGGLVQLTGGNGAYEQYRCSFLCVVRVSVGDVVREGSAVGMGSGKPESTGDVIESAVKEAETDALKRAMRTFGNTFGLALYEKDKSAREVGYPEPDIGPEIENAKKAIAACETKEDLHKFWIQIFREQPQVSSAPEVVEAKDARKAEIQKQPALDGDEIPY